MPIAKKKLVEGGFYEFAGGQSGADVFGRDKVLRAACKMLAKQVKRVNRRRITRQPRLKASRLAQSLCGNPSVQRQVQLQHIRPQEENVQRTARRSIGCR